MTQKSILITGCSSGIGYDAAHTLKKRGWRVFATCRAQSDCERLISEGLESFVLDYDDEATIEAAVAETLSRTGGNLDALFNNGAFAIPGAVEDLPREALRRIFETNVFGYHDLTCRLIPVMRNQGYGRIVNCSSVLGFVSLRYRGSYNSTKFALEGLTDALRVEMRDHPIDVMLIEPGPITTDFRKNANIQFHKWIDWKNSAVRDLYENRLIKRLEDVSNTPDIFELPSSAVTKKLIHAIEARRPRPRYYVTAPTYIMDFLRRALPTRMLDWFLAKM